MDISILFNWPLGKNSARVSFSGPTIEDMKYKFRVGIIKKNEKDGIYWLKPGWVFAPDMRKIEFDVNVGDSVVAESGDRESEKVITRSVWDIEKEWPANASGGTSIAIPWDISLTTIFICKQKHLNILNPNPITAIFTIALLLKNVGAGKNGVYPKIGIQ